MAKSFRIQFSECLQNKTAELMNTKETEKVEFRPNTKGIESMEVKQVYFCNKYLKRCSSKVCLKERCEG